MHADNVRTTLLLRVPTALFAFALASAPQVIGQVLVNSTSCHPLGNRGIAESAGDEVKGGASIESVTNALSCVARDHQSRIRVRTAAVRAGFAIQTDEAKARSFLLAIIRDSEGVGKSLAWELLTYVADKETESAMFEVFRETWPSRLSGMQFRRFRAFKNQEFLTWVDEQLALDTQISVPRIMLVLEAELIRVQQDGEHVLQYITSPEHPILYRVWLTRHALRCGLTRGELRNAFLPKFQQQAATRRESGELLELLQALDELQVFGEEDIDILRPLRDARNRIISCNADPGPRWAEEIIATKRGAFLRIPEALGSGQ